MSIHEVLFVPDNTSSHHGDPTLSKHDIKLIEAYQLWVRTVSESRGYEFVPDSIDILKSRLFWRIRSGKLPLLEAPPTCYSCPWYELIDNPGPHSCGYPHTEFNWDKYDIKLSVAQCLYKIESKEVDHWIVSYGTYKFKAWNGLVPATGIDGQVMVNGGWIQLLSN